MPEIATFAAGCFWGVEVAFRKVSGVISTRVGYMGGSTPNPSYKQVCGHTTGHVEVCEVTFDPSQIQYESLLQVFWQCHDPTQLNRQGLDVGDQYRSVIFFHTPEQETTACESMQTEEASGRYKRPIVTRTISATEFWPAEDYHQQYLEKRGLASCHLPD